MSIVPATVKHCETKRNDQERTATPISFSILLHTAQVTMTAAVTLFRVITSITSIVMLLSPSPSIYKIYKTKSTGVASIVPIVTMFSNAHAIVMFGYLTEQYFPVFSTFVVGEVLSLTYIAVFYRYTHEKHKAHKVFLLFGIPLLIVTIYAFLGGYGVTGQSRHAAGQVVGYVTILTSCLLYSAPMERISHVLKHRSAVFINFHMITAGTANNVMWVVYSSMVQQWIIFSPNAFSAVMGVFQISLYFAFHPNTHPLQVPDAVAINDQVVEILGQDFDLEKGELSRDSKVYIESPSFVVLASPIMPPHQPASKHTSL